jgi:hypothetical protein
VRLHQRIGDWLERAYGTQADALSTQLAWHFEEGRDYRRAIRYLISTAESTAGRFAYRDAIRVLQRALELAGNVDAGVRPAIETEILERIGDAHYCLGAMADCAKSYRAEAARAAEAGVVSAQIRALSFLAWPFGLIDPDQGIAAVEQAAQLSASCDDPLLRAGTELLAGSTRLWYDRWREEDWMRCASARQRIDDLSAAGLPPYHRMIYAHLEVLRGNYGEALRQLEAGIATANQPTSMMVNFFAHSGEDAGAAAVRPVGRAHARRARRQGDRGTETANAPWLFVFREAWLRTVALDFAGARALCDSVIRETTEYPTGQPQTIAKVASAYAQLRDGQHADALPTFAEVIDPATTPKFFLHWYWRMNAQLGLADAWLAQEICGTPGRKRIASSTPRRRRRSRTCWRSLRMWRRGWRWPRRTGRAPNVTSRARSRSWRSTTSRRRPGESMPRAPTSRAPSRTRPRRSGNARARKRW